MKNHIRDIKKDFNTIIGKYLFIIGKVLAIDNDGLIELIDIKKIEGYLFEFKNIDLCNNKRIGGKKNEKYYMSILSRIS